MMFEAPGLPARFSGFRCGMGLGPDRGPALDDQTLRASQFVTAEEDSRIMRLYISVDMEGITGVTDRDYLLPDGRHYERARQLQLSDLNAVIAAARAHGVQEITVNDSHNTMTNIVLEKLDPAARLISGNNKQLSMVHGIEGHDAAIFLGYHARMGTERAILDHTYYAGLVYAVRLNGVEVGETGINAAVAGHFGVPVIMVSGDQAVAVEALDLLPQVEVVQVKEALSRTTANCLPPNTTDGLLREGTRRALAGLDRQVPLKVGTPVRLEIDFLTSQMADLAEVYPGADRSGRTIAVQGESMLDAFRAFLVVLNLARSPLL